MTRTVANIGAMLLAGYMAAGGGNVGAKPDQSPTSKKKGASAAAPQKVTVHKISAEGVGDAIGTIAVQPQPDGLRLEIDLNGLPPGEHGFHLHENGSCAPGDKNGKTEGGQAAGPHFDPTKSGKHLGPGQPGHKGDLPKLIANARGAVRITVPVQGLTVEAIAGRSFMIHAGGDNYADSPAPLGGGGARIACGVIPTAGSAAGAR